MWAQALDCGCPQRVLRDIQILMLVLMHKLISITAKAISSMVIPRLVMFDFFPTTCELKPSFRAISLFSASFKCYGLGMRLPTVSFILGTSFSDTYPQHSDPSVNVQLTVHDANTVSVARTDVRMVVSPLPTLTATRSRRYTHSGNQRY